MQSFLALPGVAVLLSLATMVCGQDAGPSTPSPVVERFGTLPVFFIENRSIYPDDVKYYLHHHDGTILFSDRQVIFRRRPSPEQDIRLSFVDAHERLVVQGEERRETVVNYFQGGEGDWKTGVPTYGAVVYREIWPGIDLVLRGVPDQIKYEFRVHQGADPSRIRLRYEGIDALRVDDEGALVIESGGETIRDDQPVAYQVKDGVRREVAASFALDACRSGVFGFQVNPHDPDALLVIDPAFLAYCGYAGTNIAIIYDVAVDSAGSAYLVGVTSVGYMDDDVVLMKVSADGRRLESVTYLRGSGIDCAFDVALDKNDCPYIVGHTSSNENTFPVKIGPDLTHNASRPGASDAFICKLLPGGKGIVYCGYIGGSLHHDQAFAVAVDAAGAAWVAGHTPNKDFPVKGGPLLKPQGNDDGFVSKVKPDGTGLELSGYFGGNSADQCRGIAVDLNGDAYIVGYTYSTEQTFPIKIGPDLTHGGPIFQTDGFVAKLNGKTGAIEYAGYVGGGGPECANGVAVDSQGCAYVAGGTQSTETTFPIKIGPFLKGSGGFVSKVAANGTGFVYSGMVQDGGSMGIAIDAAGNAYISGITLGNGLPVKGGPDPTFNGGTDAFVAKIPASGKGVVYCGYVGGAGVDTSQGIAIDPLGNAYITGTTRSTEQTLPVKVGPGLRYNGSGQQDGMFVAKISETVLVASGTGRVGSSINLVLNATAGASLLYQVGSSLGAGPIPIDTRRIDLSPDWLLTVSVAGGWPTIFSGYRGVIDSKGQAQAAIHIPNIPSLIGVRLHSAFVTLDPAAPSGIRSISNALSFSITK